MQSLATLGSNKSVTTINAIMTEIFTDVKPTKIEILRETPPSRDIRQGFKKALNYMGINAEINDVMIGVSVNKWRDEIKKYEYDILDITPGRKYMALTSANYGKANQVRYIYLRNESQGYRIFGYVPFEEIEIFDIRNGNEIKISNPPHTTVNDRNSTLGIESLKALYNILSLYGEVRIKIGRDYVEEMNDDKIVELCKMRSGMISFEEEKRIKDSLNKEDVYFVADTNVYINLGNRIRELFWGQEKGFRLIPLLAVYKELSEKLNSTQRDEKLVVFRLGMAAFKNVHLALVPQLEDRLSKIGDVEVMNEVKKLKSALPNNVVLVTMDKNLASNISLNVKTITLEKRVTNKQYDMGEFLHCLSYYPQYSFNKGIRKDLYLELEGKDVAKISYNTEDLLTVNVETLDIKYNYAKVLEVLKDVIKPSS
ncbi:PIN domain-containing protein [Saccharolobus shibatae]|uniref:PIN domain-containing protein n=1 Tax=Saccharolobus shibatae TaxID=2286 RepID=A0A8F5BVF4_9CREN|nr:hypothetical protein [Saccharolobus shibatae]QXJ32049.1 Uncharacterized protein J5U21_01700 [Saccharolobus shibatae]